ncbi:Uncharacterized protein OBRU01_24947, partial [Operophtera brumata]
MKTKPQLTFSKLDEETGSLLDRMFEKKDCMMEINPGRVILPADYMTIGQDILDMEWHDESVKGTSVDLVKYRLPVPRYIRSHLPWDLLPQEVQRADGTIKPRVIYTSRNPKDMVVSYYHYCTLVHGLKGTFEEFCFWNRRRDPNLLFIKFEEMKHDLPSVIQRTANFLNKTLSDEQVEKLCDHLSFNNMKTNRA